MLGKIALEEAFALPRFEEKTRVTKPNVSASRDSMGSRQNHWISVHERMAQEGLG